MRVPGESIVVTADRIAEPIEDATDSVTVIDRAELERSQAPTVAEALRDVAGISIIQSGSMGHTTSAFVRGASPAQLLLLVDGVEINDPFFGGVDISALLTGSIERIEIVRGAQSPLYGSQAMAGVINVITAPSQVPSSGAIDGSVRAEVGGLSTETESLQLGGASSRLRWKIGGSRIDSAGQFENDEFRNLQSNARLGWDITPGSSLTLHALSGNSHIGVPFSGREPRTRREGDSSLTLGGIDYAAHSGPLLTLDVRASFARRSDEFQDPDDPYSQTSAHDSRVWRAVAQNTMTIGSQTITMGVEQKHEDVNASSNGLPALDEAVRTTAVYLQDRIEIGALTLAVGARWDRHSRFGGQISPRVSAAYQLGDRWRVRAAAGQAFRSPSVGELAYPYYGNPSLQPETSRSFEAGADFDASRASIALTAFSTRYRDLITFDPVTFVAANIDRSTIRGAELTGRCDIGDRWRADAAYTHLDARNDGTGLPLYRRPRNTASLTLTYARGAWSASANVNAIGRRFERDFETWTDRYNGGYVKADSAFSFRVRPNLRLTGRVENLFDREYEEALAFPAPGRTLHGGLQFEF